jgi:hypothetical protein
MLSCVEVWAVAEYGLKFGEKRSPLENLPVLILLALLTGAVGGLGIWKASCSSAKKQGTGGMPKAPDTGTTASGVPPPAPDTIGGENAARPATSGRSNRSAGQARSFGIWRQALEWSGESVVGEQVQVMVSEGSVGDDVPFAVRSHSEPTALFRYRLVNDGSPLQASKRLLPTRM